MAGVLSPTVCHTLHHVSNSEEFIQKIGNQSIAPEEKLVSFDVCSLFTSIPVTEAVEAVRKKLGEDKHKSELAPEQLLDLLQLCLSCTYFAMYGGRGRGGQVVWALTCNPRVPGSNPAWVIIHTHHVCFLEKETLPDFLQFTQL